MSSKVKAELDLKGLRQLAKSPEMQAHLQRAGEAVAAAAGEEYGVRVHLADYLAIVNIYPNSRKAAIENSRHNTLLKALSSSGLQMHK